MNFPNSKKCKTIVLHGGMKSDLDWKQPFEEADRCIKENDQILWQLELGLFNHLSYPLSHQGQYAALDLAVTHFRDRLLESYQEHTQGVLVFNGQFPSLQPEDLDAYFEFIQLLTQGIPDRFPLFATLDFKGITSIAELFRAMHPDRFGRIKVDPITSFSLPTEQESQFAQVGVCLPLLEYRELAYYSPFQQPVLDLLERKIPFRIFSESQLAYKWDGLDLIIVSKSQSKACKRLLTGFTAAGGNIREL